MLSGPKMKKTLVTRNTTIVAVNPI